MLAPICLFTYNRLSETKRTVSALQDNFLAKESDLFIFSDGAKNKVGVIKVSEVRAFLKSITGFKSITIFESAVNKGLANSIITGVTQILKNHETIIVLEDDLVTSPNFLDFMNQAIEYYEHSSKIISISGYTLNLPCLTNYDADFYLGHRASSLGWATWQNKWCTIDWDISDYHSFKKDFKQQLKFFKHGNDMPRMLKSHMEGKLDSWAIRWCYHQFKQELVTVFAAKSKVNHIGEGDDATNSRGAIKFRTPLDSSDQRNFKFSSEYVFDKKIIKDFKSVFSIKTRALAKLKSIILKLFQL